MGLPDIVENLDGGSWIRIISAALGMLGVGAQGAAWLYTENLPMDAWIKYHSMEVIGDQVAGKSFQVESYASFKQPVNITYADVLQCRNEDEKFVNFSSQPFQISNHYPPDEEDPVKNSPYGPDVYHSPWRYTAEVPDSWATCRIRGTQTIEVTYGLFFELSKQSTVTTNNFQFVPKEATEK